MGSWRPSWSQLALLCVVWRVLGAAFTWTYASPDEYWQGPEVAHALVFGTGYMTWEWWPGTELRSWVHPVLMAIPLAVVKALGVDSALVVQLVPRLQQAAFTAAADVAMYATALQLFHSRAIANFALVCQLLSWFAAFGAARPFSNSMEGSLCAVALWAWLAGVQAVLPTYTDAYSVYQQRTAVTRSSTFYFCVAAVCVATAFAIRPTTVILWAFLAAGAAVRMGPRTFATRVLLPVLPVGLAVLTAATLLDRSLYGHWVSPPLNFLRFNLLQGLDALYGRYPVWWYVINGAPAACGAMIPLLPLGLAYSRTWQQREVALAAGWVLFVLGFAAHKEHRFLLPLSPVVSVYAGAGMAILYQILGAGHQQQPQQQQQQVRYHAHTEGEKARTPASSMKKGRHTAKQGVIAVDGIEEAAAVAGTVATAAVVEHEEEELLVLPPLALKLQRGLVTLLPSATARWRLWVFLLALFTCVNLGTTAYLNCVHQRGPVAVAQVIAHQAEAAAASEQRNYTGVLAKMRVDFLMPCHSTPFYSVVHHSVAMRQLDCSPGARLGDDRGTFRTQVCQATGCCSLQHLPAISETDAWTRTPARMLRALYGMAPSQPAVCVAGARRAVEAGPAPPMAGPAAAAAAAANSSFDPFATTPQAFAVEFGTEECHAQMSARGVVAAAGKEGSAEWYRRLPSHIAMFDADAAQHEVSAWLSAHGYAQSHDFFHAHVTSDLHTAGADDRSSVLLFTHACWESKYGSGSSSAASTAGVNDSDVSGTEPAPAVMAAAEVSEVGEL